MITIRFVTRQAWTPCFSLAEMHEYVRTHTPGGLLWCGGDILRLVSAGPAKAVVLEAERYMRFTTVEGLHHHAELPLAWLYPRIGYQEYARRVALRTLVEGSR